MPEIDLGPVIGPRGPQGEKGERGEQGPTGPQGEPGVVDMDTAMEFTEASTRANINNNESLKTILGKIKKYFTDLKAHAFNAPANNLTTTQEGYALDARQGKALDDKVTQLNSALADVNSNYLRQYHYNPTDPWITFNMRLPANVSGYGALPFLIIVGSSIYAINVVGGSVTGQGASDAVSASKLLGEEFAFSAIKESDGRVRIKAQISQGSTTYPVMVLPLRYGISIESYYFALS